MALPATIYRASIQVADVDDNRYESLQATVARHPSETAERVVARVLAYALCYEEGLVFTKGISAGDEPDLWAKTPDDRVKTWIEVGLPEAERLKKAARHAEKAVLFVCGNGQRRWEEVQLPKLSQVKNLTIYAIDGDLLRGLVERLQRSIDWSLTISGGTLYLAVGEETLEGRLELLAGE